MGFQSEVHMGEAIRVKGARIYPLSKVVKFTAGNSGGMIWNRPVSVLIRTDSGEEHNLPVRDLTRDTQIQALAAGVLAGIFLWLVFRGR